MLGCIIQARMGSTRLPGKVMKTLDGINPSLFFTISQLKYSKFIDKIVVATTTSEEDDQIEEFVKTLGIDVFRGSKYDVLDRYLQCSQKYSFTKILRVTADCPLIDPKIIDKGISIFLKNSYDYVTNTFPRTYPDGNETEIFSYEMLTFVNNNALLPSEREHVTPYFKNNKTKFRIKNFTYSSDLSYLRWTLDYNEDLILIKKIISKIKNRPIHLEDILNLFENEPDLIKLNSNHKPNEGLLKSLKEDEEFKKNNAKSEKNSNS